MEGASRREEALAAEFQATDAGAFRRATSTPLSQATKPSSYFISRVSVCKAAALVTTNGK